MWFSIFLIKKSLHLKLCPQSFGPICGSPAKFEQKFSNIQGVRKIASFFFEGAKFVLFSIFSWFFFKVCLKCCKSADNLPVSSTIATLLSVKYQQQSSSIPRVIKLPGSICQKVKNSQNHEKCQIFAIFLMYPENFFLLVMYFKTLLTHSKVIW